MAGYRAKPNVLLRRALDHGIRPTPLAIARATGIPVRTVSRALNGAPLSIGTMERFAEAFASSLDDLFEPRDPGTPDASSLREVR